MIDLVFLTSFGIFVPVFVRRVPTAGTGVPSAGLPAAVRASGAAAAAAAPEQRVFLHEEMVRWNMLLDGA